MLRTSRLLGLLTTCFLTVPATAGEIPRVGGTAPEFSLKSIEGKPISSTELRRDRPLVLVVLRGFPGYQCPLCSAQVGGLLAKSEEFAGASVLLVYPGPADGLAAKAREFLGKKPLPSNFHFALDPDYAFTNLHGLRWDARNETAYPSTFVIDPKGTVRFAKISKTHGGRATAAEILKVLSDLKGR